MTFILDLCKVASLAPSEAASVAPISIQMLEVDSASKKTYKKTYHMPKLRTFFNIHTLRPLATASGGLQRIRVATDGTVQYYFNCL